MVPRWLVQVLNPPQKFERSPFWNGWRYRIRKHGIEVIFNGMTSLLNFIKIYQLVQKLLGGTYRQTNGQTGRQTGDLISLTFLFEESRLITGYSPASHSGSPSSLPGQTMCDLWWTKWRWDRSFSKSFGFPLSVSFHRCSIFTHISSGGWTKGPLEAQFHRDIVLPHPNNNNNKL
jgi:hypothetical protein